MSHRETQITEYADQLTSDICRRIRMDHCWLTEGKSFTPDETRQIELAVASQLETGRRGTLATTRYCPANDSTDTNDGVLAHGASRL